MLLLVSHDDVMNSHDVGVMSTRYDVYILRIQCD